MAFTSSSEKPLAMRSITVAGSCPDLNACIAVTMSAGLRPTNRGTVLSTPRPDGWQPEQDMAPGGASAAAAALAAPSNTKAKAPTGAMRVVFISDPPGMAALLKRLLHETASGLHHRFASKYREVPLRGTL